MIETMQQKNLRFDLDFILQKGYFFVLSLKKSQDKEIERGSSNFNCLV